MPFAGSQQVEEEEEEDGALVLGVSPAEGVAPVPSGVFKPLLERHLVGAKRQHGQGSALGVPAAAAPREASRYSLEGERGCAERPQGPGNEKRRGYKEQH